MMLTHQYDMIATAYLVGFYIDSLYMIYGLVYPSSFLLMFFGLHFLMKGSRCVCFQRHPWLQYRYLYIL